jgi:hypothetical protein
MTDLCEASLRVDTKWAAPRPEKCAWCHLVSRNRRVLRALGLNDVSVGARAVFCTFRMRWVVGVGIVFAIEIGGSNHNRGTFVTRASALSQGIANESGGHNSIGIWN